MSEALLSATGLTKSFVARRDLFGRVRERRYAVRAVDLHVARGETLAVVGESGAGKSTLGRLVLRLIEPDEGSILLGGVELRTLGRRELRGARRRMQMIFQDPFSSLDPRMTIADAIGEALIVHTDLNRAERQVQVNELLQRVGIGEHQAERYPYEFSGGQLQRIAIARAVAVEPDLIVCDEPVAALDVSIRAQVINLLHDLQRERGVAFLFISHDLSLVRHIADRVAVMYRGQVVEDGETRRIFTEARHPYTRALLDVIPMPDPRRRPDRSQQATGTRVAVDDTENSSAGCAYAPRCPVAIDTCWSEEPELRVLADGTRVSCHLVQSAPSDLDEKAATTT